MWDLWWIKWRWAGFVSVLRISPVTIFRTLLHTHRNSHATFTSNTHERKPGTLQKCSVSSEIGENWIENTTTFAFAGSLNFQLKSIYFNIMKTVNSRSI
jgi:hypothetical protein